MKKLFITGAALASINLSVANNTNTVDKNDTVELFQCQNSIHKHISIAKSQSIVTAKLPGGEFCQIWAMGKVIEEDPDNELSSMEAFNYYQLWLNMCYKIKNLFSNF